MIFLKIFFMLKTNYACARQRQIYFSRGI